jgi:hypothetical protein
MAGPFDKLRDRLMTVPYSQSFVPVEAVVERGNFAVYRNDRPFDKLRDRCRAQGLPNDGALSFNSRRARTALFCP